MASRSHGLDRTCLLVLLAAAGSAGAETTNRLPTLLVNGSSAPITVARGTTVAVSVQDAPGQPGEWVALHPLEPAGAPYLTWKYLDGTQGEDVPAGRTSATIAFTLPYTTGDFELRLRSYRGPGCHAVARVSTSSAELPVSVNGALDVVETRAGAAVWVTVHGPGNPTDWIGLYDVTGVDTQYLDWKYLDGSTTPPPQGLTRASVVFRIPETPGVYNFRFFLNNGYTRVARSAAVFASTPLPDGTLDGRAQPDAIPDLHAYQRLFATLQWRRELGTGDMAADLRRAGLDDVQVALLAGALERYGQGTALASYSWTCGTPSATTGGGLCSRTAGPR